MKCSKKLLSITLLAILTIAVSMKVNANWYTGNMHTHTTHSDGKNTVDEMVEEARRLGFDFLIITDHNGIKHKDDCERIDAYYDDFLCLWGSEIGGAPDIGHTVALFVSSNVSPYVPITLRPSIVAQQGGQLWIAHPYVRQELAWKGGFGWDNITGIEVWNTGFERIPVSASSRAAFRQWDELNNRGFKVYGTASSDAHTKESLASVFIRVYMEELTQDALKDAMSKGRLYGTNGPELDFRINDMVMGSTVEATDNVSMYIEAKTSKGNTLTVVLIRNGEIDEVWMSSEPEMKVVVDKEVAENDWFRVELEDDAGGYAFSNPIWIN